MTGLLKASVLLIFILAVSAKSSFAQRSNYTEDDIVTMNIQKSVCESIMQLLEEKNIDSALHYFSKKDKATRATLTKIANDIQQYKGKFTLEVSPDMPNETENHYYCKYTTDEGVTIKYRVDFIMNRTDTEYKVHKIIEHANKNKPASPPKQKGKK